MVDNKFNGRGTTVADNKPVGNAGQPFGAIKKEVPDKKADAIKRRMGKNKKDKDKK